MSYPNTAGFSLPGLIRSTTFCLELVKRILAIAAKDVITLVCSLVLAVLCTGLVSKTRADTTTVVLRPILDTHFTSTASYGSSAAVQVRGSTGHKGFLKFSFSTIPPNSMIVWANLKIKVTGVSNGSFKLYKVLKDWDETATWTRTSATGGTSWGTPGAGPVPTMT